MVNYHNNPAVGQRFTLPSGVVMECAVAGATPIWKAVPYVDKALEDIIEQVDEALADAAATIANTGYQCLTLEMPWLGNEPNLICIPDGDYPYRVAWSPSRKTDVIWLDILNQLAEAIGITQDGLDNLFRQAVSL